MTAYDYDLFTIGAGSGGVRASRIAAGFGARVGVAEEYRAGGTCVIRGCVPKKLFVLGSRANAEMEDAAGFGWSIPKASHDWVALIRAKDEEIARLEGLYRKGVVGAGGTIFDERAVIEGPNKIRLTETDRVITAKYILVATGAHPHTPGGCVGAEHAITSNEAFHLPKRPDHAVIVGAGYIALEFAAIFRGYGSDVTVIHHGPEILRGFDRECATHLHHELEKHGIKFIMKTGVDHIERKGEMRAVRLSNGQEITGDVVMFATGRWPKTKGLGLESVGLETDEKGAIRVDAYSRTTVPSIYAVGDVTDRLNLTPVAIREGHAVAETLFNNNPISVNLDDVPTAVFTTPEFASVGDTEEQARKKFNDIHIYKARFRPLKTTLSKRDEHILMKLIVDAATDRVVGAHMVGEHAGETIQMAGIAVKMKATKADFDRTVALHPSAAEEFVTMRTRAS